VVVQISVLVFKTEDGGTTFLRNVSIYLQVHTILLPRRRTLINFFLELWLPKYQLVKLRLHTEKAHGESLLYIYYTIFLSFSKFTYLVIILREFKLLIPSSVRLG
jgi:hypothetical protein